MGSAVSGPISSSPEGLASYADVNGQNAEANLDADMTALYGAGYADKPQRITRMFAMLSREALATDLILEASPDQTEVSPEHVIYEYPQPGEGPCPPWSDICGSGNGSGGDSWSGGSGGEAGQSGGGASCGGGQNPGSGSSQPKDSGCATGGGARGWPAMLFAAGLLVLLPLRRRRGRGRERR